MDFSLVFLLGYFCSATSTILSSLLESRLESRALSFLNGESQVRSKHLLVLASVSCTESDLNKSDLQYVMG